MNKQSHDRQLTFIEHLEELRRRIIYSVVAIVFFTVIGFAFANPVLAFLTKPFKQNIKQQGTTEIRIAVQPDGILKLKEPAPEPGKNFEKEMSDTGRLILEIEGIEEGKPHEIVIGENLKQQFYYFGPIDPFLLRMKAALLIGVLLAIPVLVLQIWNFVKPALTHGERRALVPVTVAAFLLFPIGAAFAYYFTRFALLFLSKYTFPGLEPRLSIFKYLNFLLTMMIALGLVFETPLIIMMLARLGIVNSRLLARFRGQIYVGIFILSAFLTPPDAFTMLALGLPLIFLFEVSIILIKPIERKRALE